MSRKARAALTAAVAVLLFGSARAQEQRFPISSTDSPASLGEVLFRQRCYVCHAPGMSARVPLTYGPRLTSKNVVGREDVARRAIERGGPRMPGFRYGL